MKNIMFVIREGYDADYIISSLEQMWGGKYNVTYVMETGVVARKRKIKRMMREQGVKALINMFFLVVYDHVMLREIRTILGKPERQKKNIYGRIADVNQFEIFKIKDTIKPDIILVYGSGIIKKETIHKLQTDIYNIHSSILPYYRNVHSDFWAYRNGDFDKIGITIFKLDAGVDSGDIALQRIANRQKTLAEYKAENLRGIVELVPEFLDTYFEGNITLHKQEEQYATKAMTPRSRDIINFLKSN